MRVKRSAIARLQTVTKARLLEIPRLRFGFTLLLHDKLPEGIHMPTSQENAGREYLDDGEELAFVAERFADNRLVVRVADEEEKGGFPFYKSDDFPDDENKRHINQVNEVTQFYVGLMLIELMQIEAGVKDIAIFHLNNATAYRVGSLELIEDHLTKQFTVTGQADSFQGLWYRICNRNKDNSVTSILATQERNSRLNVVDFITSPDYGRYQARFTKAASRNPPALQQRRVFTPLAETLLRSHLTAKNKNMTEEKADQLLRDVKLHLDSIDGKLKALLTQEKADMERGKSRVAYWDRHKKNNPLGRMLLKWRQNHLLIKQAKVDRVEHFSTTLKECGYDFSNAIQMTLEHFDIKKMYAATFRKSRGQKTMERIKKDCDSVQRKKTSLSYAGTLFQNSANALPAVQFAQSSSESELGRERNVIANRSGRLCSFQCG